MLAAVLHGPEVLRMEEVAVPEIGAGEVLLRSRATAICGTDMRIYRSGHTKLPAGTRRILGHELAGEVARVGDGVSEVGEGMRVAVAPNFGCGACRMCRRADFHLCREYGAVGLTVDGGFAEYVRIPEAAVKQGCLLEIPPSLSFEEAALNEPLACVYNGIMRCPVEVGDVAVIVGAGPIGIMLLQMVRLAGAATTIVANRSADRLQLAKELGADVTVWTAREDLADVVKQLTEGRGADVVFTACPAPEVQEQAVTLLAEHGRVNFFGGLPAGQERIGLNSNTVHYRELTVTGSHGCASYHCQRALEVQSSRRVDLKPLITNVFDLSEAVEAMSAAMAGKGFKTVIRP